MATQHHVNGVKRRRKPAPKASALGGVIDGAEALVAATADLGEGQLEDLRSSLTAELEAARAHLESLEEGLKDQVTGVDEYVHERPWQAIGVAAGASLLTGIVIGAVAFRR